jgi:hypothetical protein
VLAVVAPAVAGVLALAAVAEVLIPAAAGHTHAFVQHRPVRLECWACCWRGCWRAPLLTFLQWDVAVCWCCWC